MAAAFGDHRPQLARVQARIRADPAAKYQLDELARLAGISRYHFVRVFMAYTGETPFSFVRRQRILCAVERICGSDDSFTRIAHDVGFGSSAAFAKAFSAVCGMTPSNFRNLGKADAQVQIHRLAMNPNTEEQAMNLEMADVPEVVSREPKLALAVAGEGPFAETAPGVWERLFATVDPSTYANEASEFLGLSQVEDRAGKAPRNVYHAAFTVEEAPDIAGSERIEVPGGRYLRWVLKGPHKDIWPAFHRALRIASESEYTLKDGPCLEVYLNNPAITPPPELLTALLVPIR